MDVGLQEQGDVVIVECAGSLDAETAPELKAALMPKIDGGAQRVVFDASKLLFVDSTGLGVLIALQRKLRSVSGAFALSGLSDDVQSIFHVTRLDRVFSIFSSLKDACAFAADYDG